MRTSGATVVDAPRAALWAALSDPERLGEALPGVDAVDAVDATHVTAIVRPATGLGATPLVMAFTIADRREGEHVRIEGTGTGGENAVALAIELDLADRDGGTEVRWDADVHLRGVLGSLVQRALGGLVADQLAEVLAAARSQVSGSMS